MTRLSEVKTAESITALIYGGSGTGKTFLAGSVGSDTLIITPTNGFATLQSALFKTLVPNVDPYVELNDEETNPDKAKGYDRIIDLVEKYISEKPNEIKNIVIEDATAVRKMSMIKGLELSQKLEISKTKSKLTNFKSEIVIPAIQDYGVEMNFTYSLYSQLCSECKRLGINLVVTAHERNIFGDKPSLNGQAPLIKVRPGFTGTAHPDEIVGLFDLTWHTEVKGGGNSTYYQIRTQGDSTIEAKTRWGGLFPSVIEKFYPLSYLFQLIRTNTPLPRK